MSHTAYKYQVKVGPNGTVSLAVPLPEGSQVEVLVRSTKPDDCTDLLDSAASSIDFWNNPFDDEDWNDA